jgi:hypothetical protein
MILPSLTTACASSREKSAAHRALRGRASLLILIKLLAVDVLRQVNACTPTHEEAGQVKRMAVPT